MTREEAFTILDDFQPGEVMDAIWLLEDAGCDPGYALEYAEEWFEEIE